MKIVKYQGLSEDRQVSGSDEDRIVCIVCIHFQVFIQFTISNILNVNIYI